jgi:chromosome segregation ATPase
MCRVLLVLALIACSSEDKPRQVVEDKVDQAQAAGHAAKVKALEAAELAAREAEAAAKVATEGAEKAKQEMLAAKDELAKTSAERAKLADEGRAVLAAAREKLTAMEAQLAKMAAKRDEAKAALAKMTDEQKRNAAAGIAEIEKKYAEAADQLQRLRATMAELEKSLTQ